MKFDSVSKAVLAAALMWFAPAVVLAADAATPTAEAGALDELVVTASKIGTKVGTATQAVTVVTADDIAAEAQVDLTEVLRQMPGIEFKKAGGPGQFNYLRLRGFSDGVLYVLDGVKINEGSSGGIGNMIGQIDPGVIGRMEVLRGPQATLYGANSTAGVISVTTRSGEEPGGDIQVEAGSLDWNKASGSIRNTIALGAGRLAYALSGSTTDSGGVHDFEFYKDDTIAGKLSWQGERIGVGGSLYRTDNSYQYAELKEAYCCQTNATYWSFQAPDPNQTNDTVATIGSLWVEHKINDHLSHKLLFGAVTKDGDSFDANNGLLGYRPAPLDNFSYEGAVYQKGAPVPINDTTSDIATYSTAKNTQFTYDLVYKSDLFSLLGGAESIKQSYDSHGSYGSSNPEQDVKSLYSHLELHLLDSRLLGEVGVRYDDYNAWGGHTTYSVGGSYALSPATTLYANFGTSFTQPTLSQLFNPTYGFSGLSPATGKTYEAGIRHQAFDGRLRANVTIYNAEVENIIAFDYSIPNPRVSSGFGRYANRGGSRSSGAELQASYDVRDDVTVSLAYTYTDAETTDAANTWIRMIQVADNKVNVGVNYHTDKVELGANLYRVSPRLRWAGDVETKGYTRLDLSARYFVTEHLNVYSRVQNALDTDIIEELGYEQPGLYAIAGIGYRF